MVDGCPRPLSTMEWSKRAGAFDMSKFLIKFKDRHADAAAARIITLFVV